MKIFHAIISPQTKEKRGAELIYKAVIFDLDGVIVSTDEYHYLAWKTIAENEEIYFDRKINEGLRGVSRMESLEIMLRKADREYTAQEKEVLAYEKNEIYKKLLEQVTPEDILPGVRDILTLLKQKQIKTAIGSSSKNAVFILNRIGLRESFDAIADGNDIKKSKPDPEVFLTAARKLGVIPHECLVVEDAWAGIDGAVAAGMGALGVGYAAFYHKAQFKGKALTDVNLEEIIK